MFEFDINETISYSHILKKRATRREQLSYIVRLTHPKTLHHVIQVCRCLDIPSYSKITQLSFTIENFSIKKLKQNVLQIDYPVPETD